MIQLSKPVSSAVRRTADEKLARRASRRKPDVDAGSHVGLIPRRSPGKQIVAVSLIGLTAAMAIALGGCSKAPDPWDAVEGGQLRVLVSFPPLYCFTKAVADKDAKVQTLLAATGPHDHHATASDAHLAAGANLFFVNGLTLDDFVTTVANSAKNRDIKIVKI